MKGFDFLEEHEFFEKMNKEYAATEYVFENKEKNVLFQGVIFVPTDIHEDVYWEFKSCSEEMDSTYKKIEATPQWFQELVHKTERKYEQVTRLKRLFNPKKLDEIEEFLLLLEKEMQK